MRAPGRVVIVALLVGGLLACAEQPAGDWLDEAVLLELAAEQGSASGSSWSGSYALELGTTSCDCPSVALEGETIELCSLVELATGELELSHADGFVVAPFGEGMLSGPVEADGSFALASVQDVSTLLGPTKLLARIEGTLGLVEGGATLRGEAGQRLVGELAGDAIDCRWLGTVDATRLP